MKINKHKKILGSLKNESLGFKTLKIIWERIREGGETFLRIPPNTFLYHNLFKLDQAVGGNTKYFGYESLKRGGYIKEKKADGGRVIYLTDKGKMEILKDDFWKKEKKWDRKWRAIIFDIPEESHKHRDFLRRKLKWFGFKELQKSIWIIPYDAKKEFEEFLKLCNIKVEGDVRYLTIEKIEPDFTFKEYLNK